MKNVVDKMKVKSLLICLAAGGMLAACGGTGDAASGNTQSKLLVSAGSVKISIPAANVTASSTDAANVPGNAVDNNLGTHWTGAAASGSQWIKFNLGGCYTTDFTNISWYQGDARQYNFTVEASADGGATWTTVKTAISAGTSAALVQTDFPNTAANVMRVSSTGSNVNTKVSINEVEFWGSAGGACNGSTTTTSTTSSTEITSSTTQAGTSSTAASTSTTQTTTTTTVATQWNGWKVSGKNIVNASGANIIMRGFGVGELYNVENYFWGIGGEDVGGPGPTFIRNKLVSAMGQANTDTFYNSYESNILADSDIAKMAGWGANSIRVPLNWHMLSSANGVYLEAGFKKIDHLIAMCKAHNIFVVLDLHAAPGAQNNELMSDSDGTARLWSEPAKYRAWTIDLWKTIARRYANETAVAGFDIFDEPLLPSGHTVKADLRPFYLDVTTAIRSVDKNHLLFIEGTNWAQEFKDLEPAWDNKIVWTFHKYWDTNNTASIQFALDIRNRTNLPVWNGETGEEETSGWNKAMVALVEKNNIGWNFWTYKKVTSPTNSAYNIPAPANFSKIQKYVGGSASAPSQSETLSIMTNFAANAATAKSSYNSAVISDIFGK